MPHNGPVSLLSLWVVLFLFVSYKSVNVEACGPDIVYYNIRVFIVVKTLVTCIVKTRDVPLLNSAFI